MVSCRGRGVQSSCAQACISLDGSFHSKPCDPSLSGFIAEAVTDLLNMALTVGSLCWGRSHPQEWWSRVWLRREDAGTTTEAQGEEQPSRCSSCRSTQSELSVGANKVLQMLERDAIGLVLMCGGAWSWVLGW